MFFWEGVRDDIFKLLKENPLSENSMYNYCVLLNWDGVQKSNIKENSDEMTQKVKASEPRETI